MTVLKLSAGLLAAPRDRTPLLEAFFEICYTKREGIDNFQGLFLGWFLGNSLILGLVHLGLVSFSIEATALAKDSRQLLIQILSSFLLICRK